MTFADIRRSRIERWRLRGSLRRAVANFLSGEYTAEQRLAGTAFIIRVASAGIVFTSQALIARWIGSGEFGSYVYVWTCLLLASEVAHFGLPLTAQRFVPEYRETGSDDLLRGYLSGSQWLIFWVSLVIALASGLAIWHLRRHFDAQLIIPFLLACAALPAYALTFMSDGLARSFNWIGLALLPAYIVRPLAFVASITVLRVAGVGLDAATVMATLVGAAWFAVAVQTFRLKSKLKQVTSPGSKRYAAKQWLATALPLVLVWGLYTLLTSTDVVVLKQFRPAEDVAHYYAAAKIVAFVSMIYFSVAATTAHRFTALYVSDRRGELSRFASSTVRWIFWLSLVATTLLLIFGRWLLLLFGADFAPAYPVMVILAAGQLVRASVGPAERVLNVLGQQRKCAIVYAAAFAFNITTCLLLAPKYGAAGTAIATAGAFVIESLLLFMLVKYTLGLHMFVWDWRAASASRPPSEPIRVNQFPKSFIKRCNRL